MGYDDGTHSLEFTGVELVEKLISIIPKAKMNLVRYFGVFSANYKHRLQIVPGVKHKKKVVKGKTTNEYWIPWAELLRRTFQLDVSICTTCKFNIHLKPIIPIDTIVDLTVTKLQRLFSKVLNINEPSKDQIAHLGFDLVTNENKVHHIFFSNGKKVFYFTENGGNKSVTEAVNVVTPANESFRHVSAIKAVAKDKLFVGVTSINNYTLLADNKIRFSTYNKVQKISTSDNWSTNNVVSESMYGTSQKGITKFFKPSLASATIFALAISNKYHSYYEKEMNYKFSTLLINQDSATNSLPDYYGDFQLKTPLSYAGQSNGKLIFASISGEIFTADGETDTCLTKPSFSEWVSFVACSWQCLSGYTLQDGACVATPTTCVNAVNCKCPENASNLDICDGGVVIKPADDFPYTNTHLITHYKASGDNDSQAASQTAAASTCAGLTSDGKSDWRLPYCGYIGAWNANKSNLERSGAYCENEFFITSNNGATWTGAVWNSTVQADYYWSITEAATPASSAWAVKMTSPPTDHFKIFPKIQSDKYVRCVRGGN